MPMSTPIVATQNMALRWFDNFDLSELSEAASNNVEKKKNATYTENEDMAPNRCPSFTCTSVVASLAKPTACKTEKRK